MSATVVPIDDSVEEEKRQEETESKDEGLFSQDVAPKKKRKARESRMLRRLWNLACNNVWTRYTAS